MKALKTAILLITLIGVPLVVTDAGAQHRGGGGGGRGGGHGGHGGHGHGHGHGGSRVGVFFGVGPGFYAPYYYYPPAYYYPPYYPYYPRYYPPYSPIDAGASAPVYIEQPAQATAAAPAAAGGGGAYWYYCRDTQTYYPYVQQCASAWERVTPNTTPPS